MSKRHDLKQQALSVSMKLQSIEAIQARRDELKESIRADRLKTKSAFPYEAKRNQALECLSKVFKLEIGKLSSLLLDYDTPESVDRLLRKSFKLSPPEGFLGVMELMLTHAYSVILHYRRVLVIQMLLDEMSDTSNEIMALMVHEKASLIRDNLETKESR